MKLDINILLSDEQHGFQVAVLFIGRNNNGYKSI